MHLRYGVNPHQHATVGVPSDHGLRLVSGEPSYINVLDALNAWPLVREASLATGRPAAASFKHVSPAGAGLAGDIDDVIRATFDVDSAPGPTTAAYLRARDADPKSSFGDMIAVSEPVDEELADTLLRVAADGIIAPGFAPGVVARLAGKKRGTFLIFEMDPAYLPPERERRDIYGLTLEQHVDRVPITRELLNDAALSAAGQDDALLAMITLRYTQSNSIVFARDGVTVGVAAGQQSRVDCTRLCGNKARMWWLRRHPAVRGLNFRPEVPRQDRLNWQIRYLEADLTAQERRLLDDALAGPPPRPLTEVERHDWCSQLRRITMASDAFIPFRDNIDIAAGYGVTTLVEPGGSIRSAEITHACDQHRIRHVQHGLRLFHH